MRILSWNVNGLRAACRRGFVSWLARADADVVCLQEVKALEAELPPELVADAGFHWVANPAARKGYAGVAVLTREPPLAVGRALEHPRFDQEGRILRLEFPDFTLVNVYLPHGGRAKEHLGYKMEVYADLLAVAERLRRTPCVILGDFNVARDDIDLARPRQNRQNTMFTDPERARLAALVEQGWVDSFRAMNGTERRYTWWPWSFDARNRDVGWRIDYAFVSPPLWDRVERSYVLTEVLGSDHCPVGVDLRRAS